MNVKKRNWVFVLYPESAPENWIEMLKQTGLPCVVSPLHDKDINEDNEIKKAHHHIILSYSGPTTYNSVKRITDSLNCPRPEPIESMRGSLDYLTHKNNPDKAQYDKNEIKILNGFNIVDDTDTAKSKITSIKIQLQKLIIENGITEYAEFMDYLLQNDNMEQEYQVASTHTLFFDRYISSKRHTNHTILPIKEIDFEK